MAAGRIMVCAILLMFCSVASAYSLRVGVASAPTTLDPRRASDAVSSRLCQLLYVKLTKLDENYQPQPALAHWQQLQPRHYRFHLDHEGRNFHDGSRLVAADVVATYEWVLDAANASPHRGSLQVIERIEAVDDNTVDFILHNGDMLFPSRLAIGILPRSIANIDADSFTNPIGSGSFAFVSRGIDGSVVLRRLSDDLSVSIIPVREPITRVLKVARGELDIVQGDLPLAMLPWLRRHDGLDVQTLPGDVFSYIGINLRDETLSDVRVRQALAHAIDREAVALYLFYGTASIAEAIMPPWHWASAVGIEPYEYNPQRARELLAAAGYNVERPLRLQFKTSTDPFRIRLATVYQHQLSIIGVELEIKPLEWGTFYGDVKEGRFQVYGLSWVGVKTPDLFRYAYHSSSVPPHGANRGGYSDSIADELIEAAELAPTEEATQLYRTLQARLHSQLPFIPLWRESQVLVRQLNVHGYRLYRDGRYDSLEEVQLVQ